MKRVSKDGVITVEEAKGTDTYVEEVMGMQFDRGYLSPYFVTNADDMITEYEHPLILIYDKKISNMQDIVPILEKVIGAGRPLLIIAEDVESQALGVLVVNRLRANLKVVAVKAPASATAARPCSKTSPSSPAAPSSAKKRATSSKTPTIDQLGQAEKITSGQRQYHHRERQGRPDQIKARINQIKQQIESTTSDYDREKLQERLAKLAGGVAVLYVGAATEVEMKEKKDRVDDALHATRAAVEEGIVAGGGVALVRAIGALEGLTGLNEDETIGIQIVRKALEAPLRIIADNAGMEGSVVLQKVMEGKGASATMPAPMCLKT
jgi:chaperonin GroEL